MHAPPPPHTHTHTHTFTDPHLQINHVQATDPRQISPRTPNVATVALISLIAEKFLGSVFPPTILPIANTDVANVFQIKAAGIWTITSGDLAGIKQLPDSPSAHRRVTFSRSISTS